MSATPSMYEPMNTRMHIHTIQHAYILYSSNTSFRLLLSMTFVAVMPPTSSLTLICEPSSCCGLDRFGHGMPSSGLGRVGHY
eukprot:640591-Pleurochrysis_carterae.AAC.1